MLNVLNVDVGEHFHVTEVRSCVDLRRWLALASLVEHQTARIPDLFAKRGAKDTSFIACHDGASLTWLY